MKHFIDLKDHDFDSLNTIIDKAIALKSSAHDKFLANKALGMIFEKPSTRTRVSFEVGINQLGGNAVVLNSNDMQLGRGETVADTAKVLSRYLDIIMIRTFSHQDVIELSENASIPIINGLTDFSHPCQIMADLMTAKEHGKDLKHMKVTWLGDFNNVTESWVQASTIFGFTLNIAIPEKLLPKNLPKSVHIFHEPEHAAENADIITTDTWISMGDTESNIKLKMLKPYQVNSDLMEHAKNDAIFMHCLPAHRNEEVTDEVIDGKQSVVFDEAENRLHTQKAIMLYCLDKLKMH